MKWSDLLSENDTVLSLIQFYSLTQLFSHPSKHLRDNLLGLKSCQGAGVLTVIVIIDVSAIYFLYKSIWQLKKLKVSETVVTFKQESKHLNSWNLWMLVLWASRMTKMIYWSPKSTDLLSTESTGNGLFVSDLLFTSLFTPYTPKPLFKAKTKQNQNTVAGVTLETFHMSICSRMILIWLMWTPLKELKRELRYKLQGARLCSLVFSRLFQVMHSNWKTTLLNNDRKKLRRRQQRCCCVSLCVWLRRH